MAILSRAPHPNRPDTVVSLIDVGAGPTCLTNAPCDTLRAAIAQHGGYFDWTVDHTGWVVTLHLPEEEVFSGSTLEDGLLSCLAWLVAAERRGLLFRGGNPPRNTLL
jgi:hypothetical protein